MPIVTLKTSKGIIKIELDTENTPETANNFLTYVNEKFYDGVIFHRVIKNFMIQAGGFTPDMQQKKTHPEIKNEANKGGKNKKGTIAMARTSDPHSASSQFFINLVDNEFLDFTSEEKQNGWGYCAFGQVIEGIEVVTEIGNVKTGSKNGHGDVPLENIVIESVTVEE